MGDLVLALSYDVLWTGQVVDDGVEQGLDAFVLEGAPTEQGHGLLREDGRPDGLVDQVLANELDGGP